MLNNDLFKFTHLLRTESSVTATIELNPSHPIFNGHFPGQPVLPGVCMLQIIKELLEVSIGKTTRLRKASECKF